LSGPGLPMQVEGIWAFPVHKVRYGTVQIRRSESGTTFGMPDQNLTKPPELPTPAPANQVAQQPGSQSVNLELNRMSPAPNSSATPISASQNSAPSGHNSSDPQQRIPYWLQQAERFLRVIVRMYLGLLVCCAPWYPAAWDNNPLFASSPSLQHFVTLGAVRGLVSGLGILNLWIAVRAALRRADEHDSH
jgi:hypothetical protein